MGCSDSKLDALPAVVLCRDRCKFLDHALRHANSLSRAHTAYTRSLSTFGDALQRCTDPNLPLDRSAPPIVLDHKINPPKSIDRSLSSSRSSNHIKFNSDDTESNEISEKIKSASFNNSQLVTYNYDFESPEDSLNTFFDKFTISYMKKHPAQSITYTRPPYDDNNHYEINEFSLSGPNQTESSSWNLMNFFDPYDLPFRGSSRRDMKAIAVIGDSFRRLEQKSAGEIGVERQSLLRSGSDTEKEMKKETEKKKEIENGSGRRSVVAEVLREVNGLFRKASESGDEVVKLFGGNVERVCYVNGYRNSANGGLRRESAWQPYSMTSSNKGEGSETTRFIENKPSKGKNGPIVDGDSRDTEATTMTINSENNLASALKKLCMWEKKLHREVKAEEKLRVFHARKSRELKQLIEKGAEANKIDSARSLIRSLSTSLKISIHVIAKISTKINKLRDEELWPLINDLILCLSEMWKTMLECHRRQLRVITSSKVLDSVANKLGNDAADLEVFMQLRLELHGWNLNFLKWVDTQKCFARSLNDWLLRCLTHEPEAAAKALKSSAIEGAPPVFAICNEWVQTLEGSIKEKEVMEAMEGVYGYLKQITEDRINPYLQPKKPGDNKEMERKVRRFVKEDQKMGKAMQDIEKRLHRLGKYSTMRKYSSLQTGLENVFEAVERVALHSVEAYEELSTRVNDARVLEKN